MKRISTTSYVTQPENDFRKDTFNYQEKLLFKIDCFGVSVTNDQDLEICNIDKETIKIINQLILD